MSGTRFIKVDPESDSVFTSIEDSISHNEVTLTLSRT